MTVDKSSTERDNPESIGFSELSAQRMSALLLEAEAASVSAMREKVLELAEIGEAAGRAIMSGGRIVYVGAGTSGRLGVMDAAECVPTFGCELDEVVGVIAGGADALTKSIEGAEDDAEKGAAEMRALGVSKKDIVIGISASGRARFVVRAIEEAQALGALTSWITSCEEHPEVDYPVVFDTGPEVISGSTRLKAGTAAKIALNVISTVAMARAGRVSGNKMTRMRPVNEKLKLRAVSMVSEISGISVERAKVDLECSGWDILRAIKHGERKA